MNETIQLCLVAALAAFTLSSILATKRKSLYSGLSLCAIAGLTAHSHSDTGALLLALCVSLMGGFYLADFFISRRK